MAASTLSSVTPTGTELASRQLIQSANRNPVESNMRRNESTRKALTKEEQIDTSDLFIENALVVSDGTSWQLTFSTVNR